MSNYFEPQAYRETTARVTHGILLVTAGWPAGCQVGPYRLGLLLAALPSKIMEGQWCGTSTARSNARHFV
jgi:hypothetical protein